jgi:Uma2 family endonuclease
MTVATDRRRMTLQEFVNYDDGTNRRYELVDGILVEMGLGTGKHGGVIRRISKHLEAAAENLGTDWIAVPGLVGIETEVPGKADHVRIPDVTMMSEAQWAVMEDRPGSATIFQDEPAPIVVVEVLSPSTQSIDLNEKRTEYVKRGISEYWIIDPLKAWVKVGTLSDGAYQFQTFSGDDAIVSLAFPELKLTAAIVLAG